MTHADPRRRHALVAAGSTALGLASLLLSACQTSPIEERNHWSPWHTGPRIAYHVLGYPGPQTGEYTSYRDFQWHEKQEINLTLRRHFLNSNPHNPQQPDDPAYYRERPPHSLADPIHYMHLSSLATGFVVLAATQGSAFVPIPIDSLLGTLEPGGGEEFAEGFASERRVSPYTRHVPPTPQEFEVKNPDPPRRSFR
jgi:hypothetical protein